MLKMRIILIHIIAFLYLYEINNFHINILPWLYLKFKCLISNWKLRILKSNYLGIKVLHNFEKSLYHSHIIMSNLLFNVPNHYTFAFVENCIIIKTQNELNLSWAILASEKALYLGKPRFGNCWNSPEPWKW